MSMLRRKTPGLGAVDMLFGGPERASAYQLFCEIMEARGQGEAERIFTEVVEMWKRGGRRGRGRPKDAPNVRLQDLQLLTVALAVRGQNPKAKNTEVARKYLKIIEGRKSPTPQAVASAARALGRAERRARRRAVSKTK